MKGATDMKKILRKILLPIIKISSKSFPRKIFFRVYKIPPFNLLYHHLIRSLTDSSQIATVQGNKMYLDPKDTLNLSARGVWEPFGTEIFKKHIRTGDVFLDIGANIGYFTLIASKIVGNEGKVYSFEPDTTNFSILNKNVELNNCKNVTLVKKAVSDKTGKSDFYLDKNDLGKHSIFNLDQGKRIEIETVKLDDYFRNYSGKIDLIKMDIQGAEWLAIRGMKNMLEKNEKVKIYTELDPDALIKSGTNPQEYMKMLTDLGFDLYIINELKQKLEKISKNNLPDKIYGAGVNLLCLRS
jgi:FkbM family methyltransferase